MVVVALSFPSRAGCMRGKERKGSKCVLQVETAKPGPPKSQEPKQARLRDLEEALSTHRVRPLGMGVSQAGPYF